MRDFLKNIIIFNLLIFPLSAFASNNGIPGYSQDPTGANSCHDCHTFDTFTGSSSVQISGSNTVIVGTTNTYTFKLIGPRATSSNYGGFDLSTTAGTLISTDGETSIINSELVQSGRKLTTDTGSAYEVQWSFDWQAPAVTGTVTFSACGLPVNGDGTDAAFGEHSTRDGRVACTTLSIQVQAPPNAQTGSNQTVTEGDAVSLDGSASSDVDGVINSYLWEQTAGTTATLSNANSVNASFNAPAVASNTTDELIFRLTVTDNDGLTDTSTLSVFVQDVLVSNIAPTADAGLDQSINENTLVTLTAAGSSDDGSIVAYLWQQTAGLSSVTLSDDTNVSPTFTAPLVDASNDVLSFQVTVTDDLGVQSTDSVNITVNDVDTPPTAVISDAAGVVINTLNNNSQVTLYGSFSSDPEGPITAYNWAQTAGTLIIAPGLSNESSFTFTTPDEDTGSISIELTVTGDEGVAQNTITASFTLVNQAPTADAGADQLVNEGALAVTLDGSASTDVDGTITSYAWVQLSGTTATLSDANISMPDFTAPNVPDNVTEELIFELTVTDNYGLTSVSTVSIFVQDALVTNAIPTADAGGNQIVNEGVTVNISASASTDDGTIVAYLWEQTAGNNTITFVDNTAISTSFTAPTLAAAGSLDTLTIKLTVTDDLGVQDSTSINITVNDVDTPPVASITDINGNAISTIINNNVVTLHGSFSSDADGAITAYSWSQTAGPLIISPSATNQNSFSFTTPDSPGSVIDIQLTVTGDEGSATDSITASLTLNNPPVVAAGADQTVTEGDLISLDGSTSFDADGTITSYLWEQLSGPNAGTLTNATTSVASFTAPAVASNTTEEQVFRLTATDNSGFTSTDIISIFVRDVLVANIAPVSDAGADQSINENTLVQLDGSNSTDDGTISYLWEQTAGTNTITLNDDSIATPTFTSPFVSSAGDVITFKLTVTDDLGVQSSSSVNITVNDVDTPPVAFITNASGAAISSVNNNALVTIYGNFSNDIDGAITAYSWSQIAGPAIITPIATNQNTFTFTTPNDVGNTITIQLTVTGDEGVVTNTTSVVLSLDNQPPIITQGINETLTEGQIIELHAQIFDPNNDIVSTQWTQINCGSSCLELVNSNQTHIEFITPAISAAQSGLVLEFEFTATDSVGMSSSSISKYTIIDNGINELYPADTVTFYNANNQPLAIKVESLDPNISAVISNLVFENNSIIVDNNNRPLSFPYELQNLEIELSAAGGSVQVTLYFPESINNIYDFYQYLSDIGWVNTSKAKNFDDINFNTLTGWSEISEEVEFSADRRSVTILLTDGGPSDQNPTAGIISSRSGVGENPASTETQPGASGTINPLILIMLSLLLLALRAFYLIPKTKAIKY